LIFPLGLRDSHIAWASTSSALKISSRLCAARQHCCSFFAATIALQRFIGIALKATEYGKPQHLVTSGPFAYSRNPIYVAFFVPLLSLAAISPIASAIAFSFYIVSMNFTVLRIEERDLLNKFGADFTTYTHKVRRWV
jgi:protein-S-isoprenylcysteine O-methyltransferase Ste14